MRAIEQLTSLVARLRAPDGCPWDRAQTHDTLRGYLLEETYEVVDAIEQGGADELREELGDLLFMVVLLAQLSQEQGDFDLEQVAAGVHRKMVTRHPHVFDPDNAQEGAGTLQVWESSKAKRRAARGESMLDGVPPSLPALLRAETVGEKVSRVGFD